MAVRIRLKRMGRRHRPYYRIAAVDQRRQRDGRVIEELGKYDPIQKDAEQQIQVNEERIKYWLSVGAQPSETVHSILRRQGLIEGQYQTTAKPKASAG